jgi:UDP-N-acetylglucosamine 4-epimerase
LYADVFAKTYGIGTIGLRYFNVFGPKQDPNGAYAAVIPLFIKAIKEGIPATINGDGETSRDFTFVENAVQANIIALLVQNQDAVNQVYNVACGERTTLNELWGYICDLTNKDLVPIYKPERKGDIKHSLADIEKIVTIMNYLPRFKIREGLKKIINE